MSASLLDMPFQLEIRARHLNPKLSDEIMRRPQRGFGLCLRSSLISLRAFEAMSETNITGSLINLLNNIGLDLSV
jgi:hypothetical protein